MKPDPREDPGTEPRTSLEIILLAIVFAGCVIEIAIEDAWRLVRVLWRWL